MMILPSRVPADQCQNSSFGFDHKASAGENVYETSLGRFGRFGAHTILHLLIRFSVFA